jgi:hypothetical protein
VVNVPLAGTALVLSWFSLPHDDTRPASRVLVETGRLDLVGMLGFAVTVSGLSCPGALVLAVEDRALARRASAGVG